MTGVREFVQMLAAAGIIVVAGARPASAQIVGPWTDTGFVTVNVGAQTNARSVRTTGSTPLFGETATWESTVGVGSSTIVDLNGGYRVWGNLAAAIGFSRYSDSSSSVLTARIPDPLFFDQPTTATTTVSGLEHTENAIYVSAAYVMPLTDKLEATVFVGPTFYSVKKDVVGEITIDGTTLGGATKTRIDDSAVGGHFTLDVRYKIYGNLGLIRSVGAGIFLRYSGGSIDGGSAGTGRIDVGGFNYGAGIRVRF